MGVDKDQAAIGFQCPGDAGVEFGAGISVHMIGDIVQERRVDYAARQGRVIRLRQYRDHVRNAALLHPPDRRSVDVHGVDPALGTERRGDRFREPSASASDIRDHLPLVYIENFQHPAGAAFALGLPAQDRESFGAPLVLHNEQQSYGLGAIEFPVQDAWGRHGARPVKLCEQLPHDLMVKNDNAVASVCRIDQTGEVCMWHLFADNVGNPRGHSRATPV